MALAIDINEAGRVRMVVLGSTISASTPCQDFSVDVTLAAGIITLAEPVGLAKPCGAGGTAIDQAFTTGLRRVTRAERQGVRLILSGPEVRLVFSRIPPPRLADVVGSLWTLEGLLDGEFARDPMGDPATWRVGADGAYAGTTGCRTFAGRLTDTPEGLVASDGIQDDRGPCPGLEEQDDHVLGVFDGGLRVSLFGDRMTIHAGQPGLLYRRGP